jgi:class 3 adenylate cyclase/predicted ATPase
LAVDEDGEVLVWVGNLEEDKGNWITETGRKGERENTGETAKRRKGETKEDFGPWTLDPGRWTPSHLAERILATSITDGERKTITALFADLKGSTALIEGLDPEEARAILDPALQLMMDAVHRYEGYVAQALGDGIFALFGAPIAHEDHPQRALYAALRMQEEMRRYADTLRAKGYPPLLMRVGVNTGDVVVRSIRKDDLHTDYVPVGHSTNLAARMEQMATPGSILVTAYTHKLTDGYFAFKDLRQTRIKGVEEPLHIYEVLGAGPLRTRLQVATRHGLTRFVGRHSEMEQLQHTLAQAKAGHGQIVGVMGEPGLGKSRLVYEFKLLSQSGCLVLEAYSVSHGKASPYLPVIELLKSYFDIQVSDDERKRREKVTGKVLTLARSLEDTLPYLFALLGVEEYPSPLQQMDVQIRRKRTFDALKKLFLRESLNQPVILIFEDLHWIDSETQGLLDVLGESVASARILLLTNYRPEYRHAWGQKTYYTQLHLAPFGRAEAEEFLDVLLGPMGERLPTPSLHTLRHLILEKTEGTPFFMEEVVQELVEQGVLVCDGVGARPSTSSGAVPLPTELHIPTTVQGVSAARIDRLPLEEKTFLQQLAVIGREFPFLLLRHVVPQPEDELLRLLSSLQHKEFLYEQPTLPEVEYRFKHALTQDVAYGTVLQERRKALHEHTAQAIEELYNANIEDYYGESARHYTQSGNTQKAVEYLGLAGQQAARRSAHAEAVNHLIAALELLKTLPETPERTQTELTLQLTLGPALQYTKGFATAEVAAIYTRVRTLWQQVGETPQAVTALLGLRGFYNLAGEVQTGREFSEQILRLAQRRHDPALLLEGHLGLGTSLFSLGELSTARTHAEQGIALFDHQHFRSHLSIGRVDSRVGCLSLTARVLLLLGYPDQARKRNHQALTLAQELPHPLSLSYALVIAAIFHQLCREESAAQEWAETAITLSAEQGYMQVLAAAAILRGWGVAMQGKEEEGLAHLHQGLAAWQATGAGRERSHFLALLAEASGKAGQVEKGLNALAEALAMIDKTGERYYEAELYRLRGELTLAQSRVQGVASRVQETQKATGKAQKANGLPHPQSLILEPESEAEGCFVQAIAIAQKQQAKSLELRASTSLARLWQQQGKQKEAHALLAEVYGWFTEGFGTKDLQEAKALLESLESRV